MTLESIIDILEESIRKINKNAILVLYRNVNTPNTKFPSFKEFILELKYKQGITKRIDTLLSIRNTVKINSEQDFINAGKSIDNQFLLQLFDRYDEFRDRITNTDK